MSEVRVEEFKGMLDYLLKHYEKLESLEKRLSKLSGSEIETTRVKVWKIALGGLISKLKALIDSMSRGESIAVIVDSCRLRDDVSNLLKEYSSEEDLISPVRAALAKIYAETLEICGEAPEG